MNFIKQAIPTALILTDVGYLFGEWIISIRYTRNSAGQLTNHKVKADKTAEQDVSLNDQNKFMLP